MLRTSLAASPASSVCTTLDAAPTHAIEVYVAQDVTGQLALWIDAPGQRIRLDAVVVKVTDGFGHVGRHTPGEQHIRLLGLQRRQNLEARLLQNGRQCCGNLVRVFARKQGRRDANLVVGAISGEDGHAAVIDQAAVRASDDVDPLDLFAQLFPASALQDLKKDQTPGDNDHRQDEKDDDNPQAPLLAAIHLTLL